MLRSRVTDKRYLVYGPAGSGQAGIYQIHNQNGGDTPHGVPRVGHENAYAMSGLSTMVAAQKEHYTNNPGYFWINSVDTSTMGAVPVVWDASAEYALISKLKARAYESDFNGGNVLANVPETMKMLGTSLESLYDALKCIRHPLQCKDAIKFPGWRKAERAKWVDCEASRARRRRMRVAEGRVPPVEQRPCPMIPSDFIGDYWLSWSFGVKPILSDISDLIDTIENESTKEIRRQCKVRVRRFNEDVLSSSRFDVARRTERSVQLKLIGWSNPNTLDRLGLLDPLSAAWEFLPWSFVADWVLPIGGYLDAIAFRTRLNNRIVIRSDRTITAAHVVKVKQAAGYVRYDVFNARHKQTVLNRTVGPLNVPLPGIKQSLLGGKPLERIANALSLIGQLLK